MYRTLYPLTDIRTNISPNERTDQYTSWQIYRPKYLPTLVPTTKPPDKCTGQYISWQMYRQIHLLTNIPTNILPDKCANQYIWQMHRPIHLLTNEPTSTSPSKCTNRYISRNTYRTINLLTNVSPMYLLTNVPDNYGVATPKICKAQNVTQTRCVNKYTHILEVYCENL